MYCNHCGNKISEEVNFCNKCGIAIKEKSELTNKETIEHSKIINETYNFVKVKQIDRFNALSIKTKVDVKEEALFVQEGKYYFGRTKGKIKENYIRIDEINNVNYKKSIDLVDGIYAVVFGILALIFMKLVFFIITIICLWTGYGEKILIETKSNKTIIVHTEGGKLTKEFVDFINSIIKPSIK